MKSLKVVVIGNSGHYEYVTDSKKDNFVISAVASGHERENIGDFNKEFINKFGGYKEYENAYEMLDKEKPDIAVINTVFNCNAGFVLDCLKRGINVFCEKPIALTTDELNEIKQVYYNTQKDHSVSLMGMFGISYDKHFTVAEKCIDEGVLGELRLIETQKSYKLGNREWYYYSKETYPGTIPWVSIHGIEWMYGVCNVKFDKVFSKQSSKFNNSFGDMETVCTSVFTNTEKEIIGIAASDYYRPSGCSTHGDDRMRCVGTKGILEVSGGIVKLNDGKERIIDYDVERHIFDEFIDSVYGTHTRRTHAEYTFDVTEAALKARDSAYAGTEMKI